MTGPLARSRRATKSPPLVRIEGLSVSFGQRPVLNRLSLNILPREIVTLVGLNGAGKSTLLQAVAGFLPAAEGTIWFAGSDVTYSPPHERARAGMGFFMQGGRIFPSLTVEENIEMGAALLRRPERDEVVQTVLGFFPHLIGLSYVRASLLSSGERQALALAIILTRRPRLLLLDEPLASLSPALAQSLVRVLREVNRQWEVTILIVEQNIREAVSISDRVVALVNGRRVDFDEPPESVLSSPRLEEVFFGTVLR